LHHPCFDGDAFVLLSFCSCDVQVNNTHGWHGARNLVRTNEQEKQKLLQKAKQRQQQQAMKRQQQNSSGGTRVLTLSPNPSGARSGDDTKARTAPIEYCLRTCRLFSDTRVSQPFAGHLSCAHAPFF